MGLSVAPQIEADLRPLDGPGEDGAARADALVRRLRGAVPAGGHAVLVTHGDIGALVLGGLRGTPVSERPTRDGLAGGAVVCLPLGAP